MSGQDSSASKDRLKQNLSSALPLLEEAGVVGLVEPINKYSVPGYFLNDFEAGIYDLYAYMGTRGDGSLGRHSKNHSPPLRNYLM